MAQKLRDNYRLIIYVFCTVGLCWIGVWRSIGNGAQWALAINCTGICIFPMIICRINLREVKKFPYILWSIVALAMAFPVYSHFKPGTDYNAATAVAIVNVWLYGLVAIWMISNLPDLLADKHRYNNVKVNRTQTLFFCVWLAFMVFSITSINEAFWPVWFLIMMGGFYLVPIDKKGLDELMLGITDGILVSFFWIQSRAFLYRPYDVDPRYKGYFNNVNIAAMFFLVVYIAWLARLGYARRKKIVSKPECVICFMFAGAMWDFAILTLSRSSLLAFVIITIIYLIMEEVVTFKKGFKGFFTKGVLLFLVFIAMFLPVYGCARYIPALRHHPIWYDDYSEEKVHSWDPIDSEKYTSLDEFFLKLIGKSVRTLSEIDPELIEGTSAESYSDKVSLADKPIEAEIISKDTYGFILEYSDGIKPGSDYDHPLMEHYSGNVNGNGLLGSRCSIYRYFIKGLNLLGHKESYPGVYLSNIEFYGHTHNSFLQIAYCFGIPAGFLFVILIVGSQIVIVIRSVKSNTGLLWPDLLPLMLLGVFFINGMFEMTAFLGKFMFIGAFLSLIVIMRRASDV